MKLTKLSYSRTTLVFALYKCLAQTVVSDLLLYSDDIFIVFQHEHINIRETEKQLLSDFSSFSNGFIDNKLSIYFGQDNTKSVLFGTS